MTCTSTCKTVGRAQAHCTVCHKTFTGVSMFDRHRRGGACVDLGLEEVSGLWATPGVHAFRAAAKVRGVPKKEIES